MLIYQSLKFHVNRKHGVLNPSDLAWNTPYIYLLFQEDQGAPLSFGGEFAGLMTDAEDAGSPSVYELLYYDKEFFEKLPQNPSKHVKPAEKKNTKTAH